jgi:hypothetical protein
VEYIGCLGSVIRSGAMCAREIIFRIAIGKAAFSKKQNQFTSKMDLNGRNKPVKCNIWIIALCGAEIVALCVWC